MFAALISRTVALAFAINFLVEVARLRRQRHRINDKLVDINFCFSMNANDDSTCKFKFN